MDSDRRADGPPANPDQAVAATAVVGQRQRWFDAASTTGHDDRHRERGGAVVFDARRRRCPPKVALRQHDGVFQRVLDQRRGGGSGGLVGLTTAEERREQQEDGRGVKSRSSESEREAHAPRQSRMRTAPVHSRIAGGRRQRMHTRCTATVRLHVVCTPGVRARPDQSQRSVGPSLGPRHRSN